MSRQCKTFACLLLSLTLNFTSFAQQPEAKHGEQAEKAKIQLSDNEQRGLVALHQLRDAVLGLSDSPFKLHTLIQIADLLWEHDEAQAQRLFEETFQNIARCEPQLQPAQRSQTTKEESACATLRHSTILVVSRRAPELAVRLLDSAPVEAEELALRNFLRDLPSTNADAKDRLVIINDGDGDTTNGLFAQPGEWAGGDDPNTSLDLSVGFRNILSASDGQSNGAAAGPEAKRIDPFEVLQALDTGDFDQAATLINKESDTRLRTRLTLLTQARGARAAVGKGDFEAALRYANELPGVEQRARLLAEISGGLAGEQNSAWARGILAEAETLAFQIGNKIERAQTLLVIAGAMGRFDAAHGLEVISAAIETINQAEKDAQHKDATSTFDDPSFKGALTLFARQEFERTWQLAQTIEKPETAVLIQLALCQGALTRQVPLHSPTSE